MFFQDSAVKKMVSGEAIIPMAFKYASKMPGIDPEYQDDKFLVEMMSKKTYGTLDGDTPDDPSSD